ncbi:MAG TPA: hypothetical protein VK558_15310 [Patescibacteria group bacterium]|nr:hypothetical protein [Patescibacteria group bacterium]
MQSNLYVRPLVEATHNGDGSGLSNANCGGADGICDNTGNRVLDRAGNTPTGSATGLINNTTIHTDSLGAAGQVSRDAPLFGHANTATFGMSTDQGWTWYGVNSEIGNLDPTSRTVTGSGLTGMGPRIAAPFPVCSLRN